MESALFDAILIAATLPLVVSILSAFSARTRVKDIDGYFLYDRSLDIDSFLKTTVGYSLQVASIALFFYWTFTYGIVGSILVCIAWSGGYFMMAAAVKSGLLNDFLGTSLVGTETIHGFIGDRMRPSSVFWKKTAILSVSLASVLGLGGTMMAEIDYSSQFFVGSLQLQNVTDVVRIAIQGAVLGFTVLYVLWGGYKSAVYTDRFQVPVAYVAFSIFGLGSVVLAGPIAAANGAIYLVAVMATLFSILLWRRLRILNSSSQKGRWDELTAVLTFAPIILAGIATMVYLTNVGPAWSLGSLTAFLFPSSSGLAGFLFPPTAAVFLGFGAWGSIALIFANGVWQFIDISSLQRLQSLDKKEVDTHRDNVAKAIRTTGLEAGIGWLLIALTAALLNASGITRAVLGSGFVNETFGNLLHTVDGGKLAILVPIFVFTAVVYMLSTISGFISAISYISFYDVVPAVTGIPQHGDDDLKGKLQAARATTAVVIAGLFLLYLLLRELMTAAGKGSAIATVLYAIYAFQIAITPSAIVALFFKKIRVSPLAVVVSVIAGLYVAYATAIDGEGWKRFEALGMDAISWGVVPPLASAIAATVTYAVVSVVSWPFARPLAAKP